MRVKATLNGFINGSMVQPGDEFDVTPQQFSKRWMVSLEPAEAPKSDKASKSAKVEQPAAEVDPNDLP